MRTSAGFIETVPNQTMQVNDDPKLKTIIIRQPNYVSQFRCIGSECEDTCCQGSTVVIDNATLQKYRNCPDNQLRLIMDEVVVPNPSSEHDSTRAYIAHSDSTCPFLNDHRLCAIQESLGSEYLSRTCDTYPRAFNIINGTVHRTMYMSCPEAARLALLEPNAMELVAVEDSPLRFSEFPVVNMADDAFSNKPYAFLYDIQTFVVALLKNRELKLWERLVIVGMFAEQLSQMVESGTDVDVKEMISSYNEHISHGMFNEALSSVETHPQIQLNFAITALEHRLTSHLMSDRFLNCYQQFMDGVLSTAEEPSESVAAYYDSHKLYFDPVMKSSPQILENYLINSVLTTLFPLGAQTGIYITNQSIFDNFLLLVINYTLIRSILIGTASTLADSFSTGDAIRVIQAYSKNIEHNPEYMQQILKSVHDNGMDTMGIIAVLLKD